MQYKVKFIHLDGKEIEIILSEDKIKDFFENLNKGEIYWTDEKKVRGFWLNLDKIRYIEFFEVSAPPEEKTDEEANIDSSKGELLTENEGVADTEGEPRPG